MGLFDFVLSLDWVDFGWIFGVWIGFGLGFGFGLW